jgi:hypothetical protein
MAAALTRWPAPWVPPALVVLAGGSLWASDFSIVILAVVVAIWLLEKRDLSPFLHLAPMVAGAGTILFLVAAKHTAPTHPNLFSFSSLDGFLVNLTRYGNGLTELFFAPPYALLILSGGLAAARLAVLPASFSKRCSQIGLLCVIASYLTLVGSRWVELNKGSMRYLDIVFFCFVLTLLLAVSAELNRKWKIVQYALLVGSVALHLASLMPYVHSSPSARDTLRPLLASSCTAFIGDYWTTYLVAGMFPDRFLATPHDDSSVRSTRMRDAVLAQKEICLIKKEGWSNGLFHRRIEPATAGTYTVSDAPAGFEPYGGASGALAFTPGRTYRARVYNGQHSEERWFTTATCQESEAPAITSIISRCEDMVPQATIHFSGSPDDRGGFFVDIDQDREWSNGFFHRRVEPATAGTYTVSDAPAGFEPYGGASGTLTFTPGRTYRAWVDNGQHSEERWFTTATCQESGAPAITSIVSRCEDMIPQATIHFSGPPDDRGGFFVDIDQEAIDPKTEWLEKFPEEITQFGVVLKKIDSPQRYGKFSICRYAQ